nr:hypothetical protein [Tanacetum cinerariifolium]
MPLSTTRRPHSLAATATLYATPPQPPITIATIYSATPSPSPYLSRHRRRQPPITTSPTPPRFLYNPTTIHQHHSRPPLIYATTDAMHRLPHCHLVTIHDMTSATPPQHCRHPDNASPKPQPPSLIWILDELNGGYVAFRGNHKGGKITGKVFIGNIDEDLSISLPLHNLTEGDSNELSAGTSLPKGGETVTTVNFQNFK